MSGNFDDVYCYEPCLKISPVRTSSQNQHTAYTMLSMDYSSVNITSVIYWLADGLVLTKMPLPHPLHYNSAVWVVMPLISPANLCDYSGTMKGNIIYLNSRPSVWQIKHLSSFSIHSEVKSHHSMVSHNMILHVILLCPQAHHLPGLSHSGGLQTAFGTKYHNGFGSVKNGPFTGLYVSGLFPVIYSPSVVNLDHT